MVVVTDITIAAAFCSLGMIVTSTAEDLPALTAA